MTKILGLEKLQRKLGRLAQAAVAPIEAAMEEQADTIVAMMKSLVPEDSGALRDSIGWTWGEVPKYAQTGKRRTGSQKRARRNALRTGYASTDKITITIYAGSEFVRYAHLVEWGAAPHIAGGKFAGAQHPGATAQPFFFVSWRANKHGAGRAVVAAVKQSVRQVAAS